MAEPRSTLDAVSLPPEEAIAFLRQKTNTTSRRWTDVWNEAHTRSFMVAGAATKALVDDFRGAVAKALEQGISIGDFRKEFDAIVDKHGWAHNGTAGWRASIIYETNLSTAYAAGRYAQMTEPDTLRVYPYWQYMHTSSARPRPQHLAWVGTTLAADDPWWATHYPPNGWRCKCSVRPVSEAGMRRQGKRGPDQAPPLDLRPWRSSDGRVVTEVPHGIDPGFAYSPGRTWQEGLLPPQTPSAPMQLVRPRLPPAEGVVPPSPAEVGPIGPLHPSAMRAIGAEPADVALSEDTLAKQLVKHPELTEAAYRRLPELLASPQLIIGESARKVVLIGHFDEGVLAAFVKTAADGSELYLTSFRHAREKDLGRLLRRGAVLLGSLAAVLHRKKDGAPEGPPANPT